jgi:NAD(P)-dependent dehydrogenase (short-subunit alcohol dehydrogenase family)
MLREGGRAVLMVLSSLEKSLFDTTLHINLSGAFYSTQHAARQMKLQGHGGSIIAISSISALVGGAQQTHYTPTKAGVLSLMQSCACALGKYGIRCNAILPGTIKTQLNEKDLADPQKKAYMEGRIPLGRTGEPEDLAGPAVFLASDMAKYVVSFVRFCSLRRVLLMRLDRLVRNCLLTGVYLLIYSRSCLNQNLRLHIHTFHLAIL